MRPLSRPGPNDLHFSTLAGSAFPQGERFVLLPKEGSVLVRLELASSHLIKGLRLVANKDGQEQVLQVGVSSSATWRVIPVDSDLMGLHGRSGWYIDALGFQFADGSRTQSFGGQGGDVDFQIGIARRQSVWQGRVVGLWGYADDVGLEALGLVFWSVERRE
jgi:hypothetical protein